MANQSGPNKAGIGHRAPQKCAKWRATLAFLGSHGERVPAQEVCFEVPNGFGTPQARGAVL